MCCCVRECQPAVPFPVAGGRDALFRGSAAVGRGGRDGIGGEGARIDVLSLPAAGAAEAQVVGLVQQSGRGSGVERVQGLGKLFATSQYVDRFESFAEERRIECEGRYPRGREGVQESPVAQRIVVYGHPVCGLAHGAVAVREQAGQPPGESLLLLPGCEVPQGHMAVAGEREYDGVGFGQGGSRANLLPQAHQRAGALPIGQGGCRVGRQVGRGLEDGPALSGRDIVVGGGVPICLFEQIVLPQDIAACKEQAQGYAEVADMSGVHPIGLHVLQMWRKARAEAEENEGSRNRPCRIASYISQM